MRKVTLFSVIATLAVGLALSVFILIKNNIEIKEGKDKVAELTLENRKLLVLANILDGATTGLHQTQPDTIKMVNKVVVHILSLEEAPEEKFKDCWNRRLHTTQWGSDGPYGLLDECIDSIKSTNSAILIREMDRATDAARSRCSEGNNRYEMAKNCWADRNYRLIRSAREALFLAITEPDWLGAQDFSISEK